MIHPFLVNIEKQDLTLSFTEDLRSQFLITLLKFLESLLFKLIRDIFSICSLFCADRFRKIFNYRKISENIRNRCLQANTLFCVDLAIKINTFNDSFGHCRGHLLDRIVDIHTVQNLTALFVDKISLDIHNIIVLKNVTSGTEVHTLDFLLGTLDLFGKEAILDLNRFIYTKLFKCRSCTISTEKTHKIIIKSQEELRTSRIALTAGTTS